MSKVHIALVGKQTIPIYQGIKYSAPDKIYFICSDKTMGYAQRVASFFPEIKFSCILFPPNDLPSIRSKIDVLKESLLQDDDISINLVGGTKAWSVAFRDAFYDWESTFLLVDQNCLVWDVDEDTYKVVPVDGGLKNIFRLNGFESVGDTDFSEFDEDDAETAMKLEELWDIYKSRFSRVSCDIVPGRTLTKRDGSKSSLDKEYAKDVQKGVIGCNADKLEFSYPNCVKFLFSGAGEMPAIRSKHAVQLALNAGWFEYKVAALLSRWDKARDIHCGCTMVTNKKSKDILNEFDVIVATDTKPVFVECKTAITRPTDIDKFAAGVKKYGGSASKGVFITQVPINQACRQKMKDNKICYFELQTCNDSDIFEKLDEILYEINE